MKKMRKITKEEREILLNMQLRSKLNLLVLFYISFKLQQHSKKI